MFIKICGTTNADDALLAASLGADALGFVFAESKRQVNAETVAAIVQQLPAETLTIGVFRNETAERISEIVKATGIQGVQLHGTEGPEVAEAIRAVVPFVVQVFTVDDPRLERLDNYPIDAVLLDLRLVKSHRFAAATPSDPRWRIEPGQCGRRHWACPSLGGRRCQWGRGLRGPERS